MSKILMAIGLFFGVVIFFRMRNERIEREGNAEEENNVKKDSKD